jgi:hypothetical protein
VTHPDPDATAEWSDDRDPYATAPYRIDQPNDRDEADDGDEWGDEEDLGGSDDNTLTRRPPTSTGREARRVWKAAAVAWTAAEIMHVTGLPGHDIVVATLVFESVTLLAGSAGRKDKRTGERRNHMAGARRLAVGGLITGAWVAWTAGQPGGVLGGPFGVPSLTMLWALTTAVAWWWVHHLPSAVYARQWQAEKTAWQHRAASWDMHGALLLNHWDTRVGEAWLFDVNGTGKKASYFRSRAGHYAETIAGAEGLRPAQVQVTVPANSRAGRVQVTIQYRNPWKRPIKHPALVADHEIELPGLNEATCHDPFPVGQAPETGRVLTLPVWTEDGARVAYLLGTRGAGKSTLMNCIYERGTACRDVLTIGINLDKASELLDWAPACHLTAIGPDQWTRAVRILRLLQKIRWWRSQHRDTRRGNRDHRPTRKAPLILVIIDEIDAAAKFPAVAKLLGQAYSKDRSEGIAWVTAGQRATADWMGGPSGANIRPLVDTFAVSRITNPNESALLLGQNSWMPDMTTYGGTAKGVWGFVPEMGAATTMGRTWKLRDTEDIDELVNARARHQPQLEPELRDFLGDELDQLLGEDVFARWARGQWDRFTPTTQPTPTPSANADASPSPEWDGAAVATLDRPAAGTSFDELERMMREEVPGLDEMVQGLGTKADEVRRVLDSTPDPATIRPEVTEEQMRQARAVQWQQVADLHEIPQDRFVVIVNALVSGGKSARELAAILKINKAVTLAYMHKLRLADLVGTNGAGGAAQKWVWKAPVPPGLPKPGDHSQ